LAGFIEKEFGAEVLGSVLAEFGGGKVYVPKDPKEHHVLCQIIGVDRVKIIAKDFGDATIDLPLKQFGAIAMRRQAVKRACLDGRTTTSIVKEFRCSSRTVHKIRARLRRDGFDVSPKGSPRSQNEPSMGFRPE
jgi:hypothetical protein